jgi:CRISPR-associated exonuclease Cas4
MTWFLLLAAIMLLLGGGLAQWGARQMRHRTGMPRGRLIYADTHTWQNTPQPLYSARYRLAGKPDYLVQTGDGVIPVEVKSSMAPQVPYLGHILQVAAYCLLVEETSDQTPAHGWLKYADALFEIDFTWELRQELLDTMTTMRQSRMLADVPRSHDQPGKCVHCHFFEQCDEALTEG